jgi:hypothetical protein
MYILIYVLEMSGSYKSVYIKLNDKQWLNKVYHDERKTLKEVAAIVGCGLETVRTALIAHNVPRHAICEIYRGFDSKVSKERLDNGEWLNQKYWVEKLSIQDIAKIAVCSKGKVRMAMIKHDITRRGFGKKGELNLVYGKVPWNKGKTGIYSEDTLAKMRKAKLGIPLSEEHKKKIMMRVQRKSGKDHPMYGRHHTAKSRALISKNHARYWLGKKLPEEMVNNLREHRKTQRFPKTKTEPELRFEDIYKRFQLPFEYTGDGKVWIGSKDEHNINPDFTGKSNGKKFAVFVNGDYWHSPLLRPQLRETQRPEFQVKQSKKHRWVPIILWETDLKREDAEAFVLATLDKAGFKTNDMLT